MIIEIDSHGQYKINKINFRSRYLEELNKLNNATVIDLAKPSEDADSGVQVIKSTPTLTKKELNEYIENLKEHYDVKYYEDYYDWSHSYLRENNILNLSREKGNEKVMRVGDVDYISLTDLAKYQNSIDPSGVIRNWMSNKNSFYFYNLWEELHNENFNSVESHRIKIDEVGYNRFTMTPNRWKKEFNAIGIIPSRGKYSVGTFAHPDIAFEFASWLNVEFKLYLITEFERLKQNEGYQNKIEWSVRRELAKTNYRIHTDSIKGNIIPTLTEKQKQYVYANEADILNVALFGMTAKEWKDKNSNLEGNMRDYANILQLVILVNLENLNAEMIEQGIEQSKRLYRLNQIAKKQFDILQGTAGIKKIENLDTKKLLDK